MAALLPSLLTAQTSELVLEVGGSQVRPPVDVEGPASTFLVGGLRASRFGATGSGAYAAFLSGRAMSNGTAGDFLSAELGAELWKPVATGWSAGTEVRAFGFDVTDPFPYRAGGVEGNVGVRLSRAAFSAQVSGVGGWGRSRVELSRYVDGPSRVMTDELWRYGGTVEILAGGGAVAVGGGAGLHRSTGGTYRSLGGRLVFGSGGTAVEVRADAWHTPGGTETTGGIALVIPFGGAWSLRGFLGRSEPDPLTLAEPGRAGGGMLLGRRLAGSGPRFPTRSESLYEVLDAGPVEARLRFSLPSPVARSVEILGDFTHWKPIDMARTDDRWVVDLSVPAGTHHFGFLVDGEWFVPEDAPHTVPDEWGRRNATLVVESNDPPVSANSVAEGAVR
jgi:hypothetical protein